MTAATFTSKQHIARLLLGSRRQANQARKALEEGDARLALDTAREAATEAEEAVTCIEDRMREAGMEVPS